MTSKKAVSNNGNSVLFVLLTFQKHCLFCGETCNLEKDPKHTGCRHRAFQCKTVGDKTTGGVDMKQEMPELCQTRGGKWSSEV